MLRIPRDEGLYSGGAGVQGRLRPAELGHYQIIEPYPTAYSKHIEALIVEVETDAGIVGIGEGQFAVAPEAGAVLVENLMGPLLVGRDPRAVEPLYRLLYNSGVCRGNTTGMMLDAVAAIETALWDILGKYLGQPVWHLLGGRTRDRVPVYLSGVIGATPEDRVRSAVGYRDRGFRAFKLFIGKGEAADVAEVTAMREALGPDVEICVDAQWMYDAATAIQLGRQLERLGVTFFETPVRPEDSRGCAAVAAALDLPVAVGECERSRYQFLPLLAAGAADIVQPDIGRTGITEGRNIIVLAETFHKRVALHLGVGLFGYIAAGLQVAAWAPQLEPIEYQPQMMECASSFLTRPFQLDDGCVLVPEGPGLGLEVNRQVLEQYTVRPAGGRWRHVTSV